jgi:calcineurin-like phosphoesterase family protein
MHRLDILMTKTVITADTHAFHANIIKYCNRPFYVVEDMNRTMADNINFSLPNGGRLIHCGDWAFGGLYRAQQFREMLNQGIEVILIVGNHDVKLCKEKEFRKLFSRVYEFGWDTNVDGQHIVFCHYAMRVWNRSHHGSWHLYGHSHGSLRDDHTALSIDVGVDCHNFRPLTVAEVRSIMGRKMWQPIDHHKGY